MRGVTASVEGGGREEGWGTEREVREIKDGQMQAENMSNNDIKSKKEMKRSQIWWWETELRVKGQRCGETWDEDEEESWDEVIKEEKIMWEEEGMRDTSRNVSRSTNLTNF